MSSRGLQLTKQLDNFLLEEAREKSNSYYKETVHADNHISRTSSTTEGKPKKVAVVNRNALTYELEKFPHNAMIIFNHEYFCDRVATRTGTDIDVAALTDTFKRFRFDVTTHNDLKRKVLLEELQRFGKQNFEDIGCICVVVLTHGSDHGYLRAADVRYSERDLFACFDTQTNSTLVGKPIIFLIQVVNFRLVEVINSPVEYLYIMKYRRRVNEDLSQLDADRKLSAYFLPTEADIIIFHSCFFGRASTRVVGEGTWFIQTVCEQLNLYASAEHLEEIFQRVRKVIALEKGFEHAKQMPVMSTTLLKKLYFLPNRDLVAKRAATNNIIETRSDVIRDSSRNKWNIIVEHPFLGVALIVLIVYCSLLYSSVVREHIYIFTALGSAYMGHFGVSWSKMLAMLVTFFFIFKNYWS